jgi:hypothetical protein
VAIWQIYVAFAFNFLFSFSSAPLAQGVLPVGLREVRNTLIASVVFSACCLIPQVPGGVFPWSLARSAQGIIP